MKRVGIRLCGKEIGDRMVESVLGAITDSFQGFAVKKRVLVRGLGRLESRRYLATRVQKLITYVYIL